ncbi:Zrt (ZRT), Irt- (IRT-) like Protein Transporter [Caenorhabditis elegans]|uniref:Zrt (ZRT), Irt- (IRT-) like Protein Transporter n=1 Tax=Caenorhabditis elegans TaxID=6239 RepID=Q17996_CAEEL|nr:Zrt (ZRT), Irt- (IRT-) like Protein Transporter [Caenorhabditis elegans]CAA90736.3 Zrt (ZRT), Irt- (IRT-) like Protein Transporter [Caenorhabditis elegans]|eukprot:NP_509719.2 Zrt (ZRT), Irt-(IRT-) like Protein Transporter [Caenorhabditis elegans]
MFWFILLSSCIAIHAQQGLLLDLHPAAGPQFFEESILGNANGDKLNNEFADVPIDSLMDPEGKPIHDPLRAHAMVLEEELRKEAAEIQKIMAESEKEDMKKGEVTSATWIYALIGCSLVVSTGILPAFLLPANIHVLLSSSQGQRRLNLLLGFAIGSLLADVFLHLLPEAYESNENHVSIGLCVLAGYLTFSLISKLASSEEEQHKACAYLNLFANIGDNFAHGLAVGSSFLVSTKFGIMTTITILLHEIPHEISDFAILLRADFGKTNAILAQLTTAAFGVLGSLVALHLHTSNVPVIETLLPFTAGGFLNIALTELLPEISAETSPVEILKQLVMIVTGVLTMSFLNSLSF